MATPSYRSKHYTLRLLHFVGQSQTICSVLPSSECPTTLPTPPSPPPPFPPPSPQPRINGSRWIAAALQQCPAPARQRQRSSRSASKACPACPPAIWKSSTWAATSPAYGDRSQRALHLQTICLLKFEMHTSHLIKLCPLLGQEGTFERVRERCKIQRDTIKTQSAGYWDQEPKTALNIVRPNSIQTVLTDIPLS